MAELSDLAADVLRENGKPPPPPPGTLDARADHAVLADEWAKGRV